MRSRCLFGIVKDRVEAMSDRRTDGQMCGRVSQEGCDNLSVLDCKPAGAVRKDMQPVWWRLSPRRLALGAAGLLVLIEITLFIHHTFYPDHLAPSTQLSAVPIPDFFWLDWVAGDYFQPRRTLVSTLPEFRLFPSHGCKNSTFMLVLVPSPPKDFSTRKLIRSTWNHAVKNNKWPGMKMSVSIEVFFVLGINSEYTSTGLRNLTSQLRSEAEVFNDIILGNFIDVYRSLTLKTLTGLNWAWQHCSRTEFVMKLDQDTLVDFPRLTDFLLQYRYQLRNAVLGKLYFNSKPLERGKWKVLPKEYPLSVYPTFAGGPCYVLSTDVVGKLVNMSQYMPPFSLEDVQVTGILARVVGVRRLHVRQLQNWKDSLCVLPDGDKYKVSMTDLTPKELRTVWAMLQAGTCNPELAQENGIKN